MTSTYQKPCAEWAEQLAASPKDLTWAERAALDQHVASCPACAATRAAYQQMDSDFAAMPLIAPHRIYAEQLPERNNLLSSPAIAGSLKSTPLQQVERPGARHIRTDGDFQQKPAAPRRVRFQRMMATLAAVLVVCALIGSAMLLFSHRSSPSVGTVSHPGPLTVYATLSNGTVYGLRPDNGAIRWQRQLNLGGQTIMGGPTVAHGVVYVGATNGSLYALRASDGALLWQRALGATPVHPIAGGDPQVIYVGASSTLYALRASDGSELWHRAVSSGTSTALTAAAPLAVADWRVYASDGTAGLLALNSGDGHILWHGGYYNGVAFVVAGDKIFTTVGTGEQIEVLRASDGQVLHMLSVQGNLGFDQGRLYVANQESGELFILDPQDERIIRQVSMACPVSTSSEPLNVQDGLVYTYSQGQVCAMHAESGQKVWRWTETRRVANVTSLIAVNHHLYFLYTDGDFAQVELYALNTSNGAQIWKYAFTSNYPYGGYFAVGN